jgi:hypothetical protein
MCSEGSEEGSQHQIATWGAIEDIASDLVRG